MTNSLNILLAPDSFKESLSAIEVCQSIEKGLRKVFSSVNIKSLPMADGGEGSIDALQHNLKGEQVMVQAHNPLMVPINGEYGWIKKDQLAIIEIAKVSGIELLSEAEKNPNLTTSFGTGELIKDALNRGCRNFIIGIGGSATNDGGTGMLEALGVRFLDKSGNPVAKGGGGLITIHTIDCSGLDPRLNESELSIACDVDNPLLGATGATYTFGPQKGADAQSLIALETGMEHYAGLLEKTFHKKIATVPGAGAAGGLGAGLLALPNTSLRSGFGIIQETVNLEKHILWADIIFTGEGKIDFQTQFGKVPYGVAKLAHKHNKPVICIAGTVGQGIEILYNHGITAIFSVIPKPMDLATALSHAAENVEQTTEQIARLLKLNL